MSRQPRSSVRARGRARRRLRYLHRLRELQLRDLGGFVYDLYRFGERSEELVRAKLDALIATDKEIRGLEELLDAPAERRLELRVPGVGGTCPACGAFHAPDARFCAECGTSLDAGDVPAVAPEPPAAVGAVDEAGSAEATEAPAEPAAEAPAEPADERLVPDQDPAAAPDPTEAAQGR